MNILLALSVCFTITVSYSVPVADVPKKCDTGCTRIYKPVCASDGKTYSNSCLMKVAACEQKKIITVIKEGKCPETDPKCDIVCTREYKPVCGSDGKTYPNSCVMKVAACEQKKAIIQVSKGKCGESTKRCTDIKCTREYKPTCGSDGQVYPNSCVMKLAACEQKTAITEVHMGKCPEGCKMVCKRIYDPVCGSDGVTHANTCEMRRASCVKKTAIIVVYKGKCMKE